MKPIKVLEILEATTGGTRRHLRLLLERIDTARFEVALAYSDLRDPAFETDLKVFARRGIRLHRVPMRRRIDPLSDPTALAVLLRLLRREGFDLIHAHSSKAGFLGRLAGRIAHVSAVVYSPHGFAFQDPTSPFRSSMYLFLEKFAARWHTHLLCVSEAERDLALRHRLIPPDRAHVLRNAIDPAPFVHASPESLDIRRAVSPKGGPVIGTVGQFRTQKGYIHLIEAIPSVLAKAPDARFLLVGDGPTLPQMRKLAKRSEVDVSVTFIGHREDTAPCYAAMDVFVLPSLWEGLPYALLEAVASGLPVVASDVAGVREVLSISSANVVVPPGSSRHLANGILAALNEWHTKKTTPLRQRVSDPQLMSLDAWIADVQDVYEKCVMEGRSAQVAAGAVQPRKRSRGRAAEESSDDWA